MKLFQIFAFFMFIGVAISGTSFPDFKSTCTLVCTNLTLKVGDKKSDKRLAVIAVYPNNSVKFLLRKERKAVTATVGADLPCETFGTSGLVLASASYQDQTATFNITSAE